MPYLRGHEEKMEEQNPFRDPPKTDREGLAQIFDKVTEIEKQVKWTNGQVKDSDRRISLLETWLAGEESMRREDKAYQSGLGQALITKKHWRAVAAVIGGVGLVAGTAGALVSVVVKTW